MELRNIRTVKGGVVLPLSLWLLTGIISTIDGAALDIRSSGNQRCTNAACEDDEPGRFNCGSRQLNCIPNTHTDVRVLDLHGNLLTKLIEKSFSHYMHLQNLDLSMNEIQTIAPGAFTGLANLTSLVLKRNKLEALASGAFTGAHRLETLDLSLNNITLIQPGTFNGLNNLRMLLLQGNHIQVINRGALFGLQSLDQLSLQNNQIHYLNPRIFDGMTHLRSLSLSNNQLTSLPDLTFLLPTLKDIWLSGNPITCDCRIEFLRRELSGSRGTLNLRISHPVLCATPPTLQGIDLRFMKTPLVCKQPTISPNRETIKVVQGQKAVLPCNASGIPEPIVTWTNPSGVKVSSTKASRIAQLRDGSLRITEARTEDSGNYTCNAQNVKGIDLARFALEVSSSQETTTTGASNSMSTDTMDAPCRDGGKPPCKPDHDAGLVCDSTAGIIATALVTFSTTLSTALIFFYIWYRRQMEKLRPRVPRRLDKHRGSADGEEACLQAREQQSDNRTFQKVINAIAMPGYLYAKPERRVINNNRKTSSLRMNKVEDSSGKQSKYLALANLRNGKSYHGSHETINGTSDYLPLTPCSSSNCSDDSRNRESCEFNESHLYENATLMIRDPNYTALDPSTICLRRQADYAVL
ncbi:uncharacterized protein [Asterias amurensis]|uniref:uncharacterized protein n=1 Tax=Asterias amurensis TaxID=7602 RepID=UPI003AB4638A